MRLFDYERASTLMDACGLDVVIAHTKHNGSYLADYWFILGDPGFLCPWAHGYEWWATFVGLPKDESKEAFVVSHIEDSTYMAYRDVWIQDRRFWSAPIGVTGQTRQVQAGVDPIGCLAQALQDKGLAKSRVGLEMRLFPVPFYRQLTELLPEATFGDAEPFLQRLQWIKSPEEVERLRVACRATETAIKAMYAAAHEGVSDYELAEVMKRALVGEGATYMWDDMAIGPKGAHMVGVSGEILHAGQIARVDLGGAYKGYPCDMSRARVFGSPTPEMARVHDVVRSTNEALREAVGPGVKCSDLYRMGKQMMEQRGLKVLNTYLGHSIGREQVHQYPCFMETDHTILQPGMVMAVEPTVRMVGIGSINIEDMVLVTEHGHEDLTTLGRQLMPFS